MSSPDVRPGLHASSLSSASGYSVQTNLLPIGVRSRSGSRSDVHSTFSANSQTPLASKAPSIGGSEVAGTTSHSADTLSRLQMKTSSLHGGLASSTNPGGIGLSSSASSPPNATGILGQRPTSSSHAAGILPPASFFKSIPRRNSAAGGSLSTGRPPSNSISSSATNSSMKPSLVASALPIGRVLPLTLEMKASPSSRALSNPSPGAEVIAHSTGETGTAPNNSTSPPSPVVSTLGRLPWGSNTPSPRLAVQKKPSRDVLLPIGEKESTTGFHTLPRASLEKTWKRGLVHDDAYRSSMEREVNDSGFDSYRRSVDDSMRKRESVTIEMGDLQNILPASGLAEHARKRSSLTKVQRLTGDADSGLGQGVVSHQGQEAVPRSSVTKEESEDEDEELKVDTGVRRPQVEPPQHVTRRISTPPSRHAHFGPLPSSRPTSSDTKSPYFHRNGPSAAPPYMLPVLSGTTTKPIRNYKLLPSKNKWMFKGHVVLGGDSALPFLGALLIVLGDASVWFSTTCVWWWKRGHGGPAIAGVGAYMCLLTITSMFMTAFRDPGILPRDLDPDPPYPPTASNTSESHPPVPLPRDLRVRSGTVRVKYCVTCKTYRPPRSSHCKMCDNCVDGCDHHCQWVNNCIGRRNYTFFITFVVTASLTTMLVLITAIFHLYLLTVEEGFNFKGALKHAPGSAVAVGLSGIVLWPLSVLTGYHIRLLLLNITTIEQVRNQAHRKLTNQPLPPNPFSLGRWQSNLAYLLCRPAGFSWVDPPGYAMQDTRKVNPGFIITPADEADYDMGTKAESENRTSQDRI